MVQGEVGVEREFERDAADGLLIAGNDGVAADAVDVEAFVERFDRLDES